MDLITLFAVYALSLGMFTALSIYVLESHVIALEREIDVITEELLKLKRELNNRR
jgi:hypothetical protein